MSTKLFCSSHIVHDRLIGRKKLRQLLAEIQRLIPIRHSNLLAVLGAKLVVPHSSGPSKFIILCEGRPRVTLQDVLEDCERLREDRATVRLPNNPVLTILLTFLKEYLAQILSALNAIHTCELVHRGLIPKWIALAPPERPGESKTVKIFKTAYHTKLLDMHRSDPFGPDVPPSCNGDDTQLPDGW